MAQPQKKQLTPQQHFQQSVMQLASDLAFTKKPIDLLKEGWKHVGSGTADKLGHEISLQGKNFISSPYTGHQIKEGKVIFNSVPDGLVGVWQAPAKFIQSVQKTTQEAMALYNFDYNG